MNDEEIIVTDSAIQFSNDGWGNSVNYDTYGFTNSFINDSMMDGMNWREIMSVYIEHNLLPSNLRNKLTHNR
tara:strand:- start:1335 stop:1550 length:216 start_codon:yes stop_codon:yes gene_type:complete